MLLYIVASMLTCWAGIRSARAAWRQRAWRPWMETIGFLILTATGLIATFATSSQQVLELNSLVIGLLLAGVCLLAIAAIPGASRDARQGDMTTDKQNALHEQWRALLPRLTAVAPPDTLLLLFDRHGRALMPPGAASGGHSAEFSDKAGIMALALNSIGERMATELGDTPRQYALLRSARAAYVVIPWAAGATLLVIINQPDVIDNTVQAMMRLLME